MNAREQAVVELNEAAFHRRAIGNVMGAPLSRMYHVAACVHRVQRARWLRGGGRMPPLTSIRDAWRKHEAR